MKFVLCTLRSGLSGRSVVAAVRMNTFPEEEHNEEEEVEWGLPPGPPPEIRVPFGQKPRREFGERIFDNRETICITVIAYLMVAILLLTSRVLLAPRERESAIVVSFEDQEELQRLEEELQRAQELNDLLNSSMPAEYESVRNAVSNEQAESMDELSEETRELFEASDEVMEEMDRNSAEYEEWLAALADDRRPEPTDREPRDAKLSGGVTVSFSLADPVRHAVRLPVPAYKCAGGGRVAVEVVVSRNGDVLAASVDKARSTDDPCMTAAALEMALRARFNVDASAPSRHGGTITYAFVPQSR